MKTRLTKNYVTTLIGLALICFCGFMMYKEKATTTELAGYFGLGVMFLRSKDSLIGLPKEEDVQAEEVHH